MVLSCSVQPWGISATACLFTLVFQHHYLSLCVSPLSKFLLGLKNWEAVGSGVAPFKRMPTQRTHCPTVSYHTHAHRHTGALTS